MFGVFFCWLLVWVNIKIRNIFANKKKEEPTSVVEDIVDAEETQEIEVTENNTSDENIEEIVNKPDKKVLAEAIEKLDDITAETKDEVKEEE